MERIKKVEETQESDMMMDTEMECGGGNVLGQPDRASPGQQRG
jgi:hypothetical protein